jgi:hypothetical protein
MTCHFNSATDPSPLDPPGGDPEGHLAISLSIKTAPMNNPASVLYGWGILIVAGAGSYYFAKNAIDERRRGQERSGARPKEHLTCE